MNVHLLYQDKEFDRDQKPPWNEQFLVQDLELGALINGMAAGDEFIAEIAKKVLLNSLQDNIKTILYRQNILKDCLQNFKIITEIDKIAIEAEKSKKKAYWSIFKSKYPTSILRSAIDILQLLVVQLENIKNIADKHSGSFKSEGFTQFFTMLKCELNDEYIQRIENHLSELKFKNGLRISASLGPLNNPEEYTLQTPPTKNSGWLRQKIEDYIFLRMQEGKNVWWKKYFLKDPIPFTFFISSRDESSLRSLRELNDQGINQVANILSQSTDYIINFFTMLRDQLAFYRGCINLHTMLSTSGNPITFPIPVESPKRIHIYKGLYDVCMALTSKQKIVGNDASIQDKNLVIITGANKGGKSTFLRSIGVSQLMMQSGMFVGAYSFTANVCKKVFTHFKKEEDSRMNSGKLDEELSRMSEIIDQLTFTDSLLLFNESFAATNEREGSEIAMQIIYTLYEKGLKIFFVTHLAEFASELYNKKPENAFFLKAERLSNGTRTYLLKEGAPIQTGYGEDLYYTIFNENAEQ